MRYSLQTWPRRAARAGVHRGSRGGPPGGQDRGCDPNHRLRHPPRWCGSGATQRNLPETRSVPPKRPRSGPAGRNRGISPRFCRCTPKGVTERVSGRFLCIAPLPHHLVGVTQPVVGVAPAVFAPRRAPPGPAVDPLHSLSRRSAAAEHLCSSCEK